MMERVGISVAERVWSTSLEPVKVAFWYPCEPAEPLSSYLNVYPAHAAREVPPLPGVFPLVLLICGTGGNRYLHSYLAENLANQGFWVVAPDLPRLVPEHRRWQELWLRPRYVQDVLDALFQSEFSRWIDPSRLLCVGHSSGGYVSLVLAGAVPNFSLNPALRGVEKELSAQDFSCFRYSQLNALVLLDPAFSNVFAPDTLAAITTPTALFSSGLEDADLQGSVTRYASYLGNLHLSRCFEDAGHYVYCNVCPPLLRKLNPEICVDLRVRRQDIHRELVQSITIFCTPWMPQGYQKVEV